MWYDSVGMRIMLSRGKENLTTGSFSFASHRLSRIMLLLFSILSGSMCSMFYDSVSLLSYPVSIVSDIDSLLAEVVLFSLFFC